MTVRKAIAKSWFALIGVGLFSAVINTLVLTGSFYMLQVYDRVLPSRSVPTPIGITILLVVLYGGYGALDFARAGSEPDRSRIDRQLRSRARSRDAYAATRLRAASRCGRSADLDQVRVFSGLGPTVLFDMPCCSCT